MGLILVLALFLVLVLDLVLVLVLGLGLVQFWVFLLVSADLYRSEVIDY